MRRGKEDLRPEDWGMNTEPMTSEGAQQCRRTHHSAVTMAYYGLLNSPLHILYAFQHCPIFVQTLERVLCQSLVHT